MTWGIPCGTVSMSFWKRAGADPRQLQMVDGCSCTTRGVCWLSHTWWIPHRVAIAGKLAISPALKNYFLQPALQKDLLAWERGIGPRLRPDWLWPYNPHKCEIFCSSSGLGRLGQPNRCAQLFQSPRLLPVCQVLLQYWVWSQRTLVVAWRIVGGRPGVLQRRFVLLNFP